jgi:hypothetical protein
VSGMRRTSTTSISSSQLPSTWASPDTDTGSNPVSSWNCSRACLTRSSADNVSISLIAAFLSV